MESILTSIKKLLGIAEDYTHFDDDVITHINTVFMDLTGLKVGPSSGFIITDKTAVWTDFVSNTKSLAAIKSYMYLRVKLLFDPPTNASLLNSMQQQIEKFEWLINVAAENESSGTVDEKAYEEIKALVAELESENETLKFLNATLQQSVDTLTETNSSLEDDNAYLHTTNESLRTRNSDLEFQNGELSARNETLLTENESLESANETLSTKNVELEVENERLEASIKPEQRKTVEITENGTTEILPDNGNTLSGVDLTVNVPSSGGTEEIENLIDQSGVLDSTDGTVKKKVEQLIDKAESENELYNASKEWTTQFDSLFNVNTQIRKLPRLSFEKATTLKWFAAYSTLETIDYYINSSTATIFQQAFYHSDSLKFIYGIDLSKATNLNAMFRLCSNLEVIQKPLNLSNATDVSDMFLGCFNLQKIKFVPEAIKRSLVIASSHLSGESIQSIFGGLNSEVTGQTLTLSLTAVKKAFETSEGANDGDTSEEWNALVASKPNWTITL